MQLSVMPKGVEHYAALRTSMGKIEVQLSVMPKGVVHSDSNLALLPTAACNYQ